jgi:hypothetical protein
MVYATCETPCNEDATKSTNNDRVRRNLAKKWTTPEGILDEIIRSPRKQKDK